LAPEGPRDRRTGAASGGKGRSTFSSDDGRRKIRVADNGLSRRAFLKRSGAAAAGGAAAFLARRFHPAALGSNERIHIGSIGCGDRGTSLLSDIVAMSRKPDSAVAAVAVSDVYDVRRENARNMCGGKAYKDYRELLDRKDIDAVIIATPDHWHARMSMDAAEAGKDIYCEKPMTYTVEEAKEVARVVGEKKRVMQVGVQSCSEDVWWQARKILKRKAIGKVLWTQSGVSRNSIEGDWNYYRIDPNAGPHNIDWDAFLGSAPKRPYDPDRFFRWRKYWDYSGGIATDLFYHRLGHLQIALGPELPRRVVASGGVYVFHDRETPDTFHMMIDYPSDHTVVLLGSQANRQEVPEIIRGHKATIYFEPPGLILRPETEFAKEVEELTVNPQPRPGHMENFLACIRSREKPHCNEIVGYRVMVAIGMGVRAYREQRVMLFDPEKEEVVPS
jgi:predicted dehydrogenase